MKRLPKFFLVVTLLALAHGVTQAQSLAFFFAGDAARDIHEIPIYQDPLGMFRIDDFEYSTSDYAIRIHDVLMDPDPSISYGILVTNNTDALKWFTIVFATPIVGITGPNTVSASLEGSLDDQRGDGVSVTPYLTPTIQTSSVGSPSTDLGLDLGPGASFGPSPGPATWAYGPYSAGPQSGPDGPWDQLSVKCSFTISPYDAAGFNGTTFINAAAPVPEPASIVLLGSGLAGLGFLRRRKKNS